MVKEMIAYIIFMISLFCMIEFIKYPIIRTVVSIFFLVSFRWIVVNHIKQFTLYLLNGLKEQESIATNKNKKS